MFFKQKENIPGEESSVFTKMQSLEASVDYYKSEYESAKREIERLKEKASDESRRRDALESTILAEKTNELKKKADDETNKRVILESEVSMYKSAFENMGFDVKDMKEILNKLVDGIIEKSTINVIK